MHNPLDLLLNGFVTTESGGFTVCGSNLVVNQGHDIVAALLAGKSNYRISHMYFEYENTVGTPVEGAAAVTDTAADIQAAVSPRDIIRAPLVATPVLAPGNVAHQGNYATFHAATNASVGLINALPFSAAANSKVYAQCLIVAPGGSAYLQDLIYARFILPAPLTVGGNGVVAASWVAKVE